MRGEDTALALAVRTAQVSHTLYSNVGVGIPGSVHFYCIVLYRFKGPGELYNCTVMYSVGVGIPGFVHLYCIVQYRYKGQGESYIVQ